MLCERCKKRPAMIYIQSNEGGQMKSKGYCLTCAKELGIKPVDDMMKKMGIDENALKAMEEQMDSFMKDNMDENGDFNFANLLGGMGMPGEDFENDYDDEFEQGGSSTIPFGKDDAKEDKKDKKKKNKRKFLDQYCENLTKKANEGKIDNIIGRNNEIYRTIQILCRRQKNNPCLIGEAGVGKTAIAEGIALKISRGEVPQKLKNKEIYLVNMTNLVAGTQFRGQFEARVKSLIGEVKENGNIILFIDEIHTITGAGDSEGAMNAGNILKPALSRGEIQVIGATTFNEYRKFIEKDAALERRFQPVKVEEPSISDTIDIISGVKQYYEEYHHVQVPQNIVDLTVRMSEKYITDRFLPDKAIDLLDEACACCNLRHTEISDWLMKKEELDVLTSTLEQLQNESAPDYEQIAHVRRKMFGIEEEEKQLSEKVKNIAVEIDDIAKVIQLWTGISAVKVKESEFNKVANLEAKLKEHIKGQDEAVSLVAKAIKRNRAGISGRNRPASFLFVGPTGVGKTELVKQLASQLFDTVDPLIRFDMSEFMEKHAVSRLVGSPPGYVGYDEAGQLTEKVRRKPYSVVLFDEIEKAHPDVMNILLQILDEGKINDAQGRTVNFENTVIAMTSNAGSSDKVGQTGFGGTVADMSREKTMRALNSFLRPEFLARIDEIVVFDPLNEETLTDIADLMLTEYVKPMQQKGISLTWDKEVLSLICKKAQGGKFGARDIRRVIRKEIEDKIAEIIVEQQAVSTVYVYTDGEEIAVTAK
ncbi:MAG: ATP-dependent Clp protease ATP-binding subunit [Oscillospiraceae bacterium]|nr:ATP-dependent Clp protease ATP-binding subunit [Oscillospiraceae bacterium]